MTRDEAWHKGRMVNDVKVFGGYARRVEDKFLVGQPDLIFWMPGHKWVFAEAKKIRGLFYEASPRQQLELMRIDATKSAHALVVGILENEGVENHVEFFFSAVTGSSERRIPLDRAYRSDVSFPVALNRYLTLLETK